jgi:hypothetical protein
MTDSLRCSEQEHFTRRVITPDGRLKFNLRRVKGGVLVGRWHCENLHEVEHATIFEQRDVFHQYLDVDQLRFRYVLQYVELKRIFDELLSTTV